MYACGGDFGGAHPGSMCGNRAGMDSNSICEMPCKNEIIQDQLVSKIASLVKYFSARGTNKEDESPLG